MKLSKSETELFYTLYHELLAYVNKKLEILDNLNSGGRYKEIHYL